MKYTVIAALLAAVVVVIAAFVIVTNDPDDKRECDVAVTMGWEKEIVDTLSQGGLSTVVLMSDNTSPHSAYSTTSSIEYLYNAKLFIEIGSGIEWETSMLDGVKSDLSTPTISCMEIIEAAEGEGGHDHEEEEHDEHDHEEGDEHNHSSHIWVSPEHLEFIAEGLADELKERFPDVADKIDAGLAEYLEKLEHIMDNIAHLIEEKAPDQTIFVWHNAWDPLMVYFNEVATETTGTEYDSSNPFMNIESGEDAGAGDTPTISTINYMQDNMVNMTIYVSPFDTASQNESIFSENGFTVVHINPTASQFLDELDEFIHSLHDTLNNA